MLKNMTTGSPLKVLFFFSLPLMAGNLFQQLYNIVDSIIVGRYVGTNALGAVGSSYTLMVFLTSILIGLCMGASVVFSQFFGAGQSDKLRTSLSTSFLFIGVVAAVLCLLSLLGRDAIIAFLRVPQELIKDTQDYLTVIFLGIPFTFLYNWAAALLRALGNSKTPLYCLMVAALTNVALDLLFILKFHWGVAGAAWATILAQGLSSLLCLLACWKGVPYLHFSKRDKLFDGEIFRLTANYSLLTSVQQSVMNGGILMIQGLVNSFGAPVMAAFAAATKIDSFAYLPGQDFGNGVSTYIAQNRGAGKKERIDQGLKAALLLITLFCGVVSIIIWIFAPQLMTIFIKQEETQVIALGVEYLHIVSPFYCLIGYLFLLYGLYRGIGNVQMSIVLTCISLGTRVALAYALSGLLGLTIIWWAIVIGWGLADLVGLFYYLLRQRQKPLC